MNILIRHALAANVVLALAGAASAGATPPDSRDAGSVRFAAGFSGPAPSTWPADAPAVRFYFNAGDSAPSCGLLVAAGQRIVPLVEPDAGADFPQCTGVPSALVLQQGAARYFLLRVRQRDTREDSSLTDLLFQDRDGMPVPLEDLAGLAAPDGKPLSQVAAWLRARWANQADAQQGAKAWPEHTATTPGAYLTVAQLKGSQCQFALGSPERATPSLKVAKHCAGVMATSAFQEGAVSWFVVLLNAGAPGRQALVFAVDAQGAREVPEWGEALGAKARDGKILPLRQEVQKLVAKRR
jgi:hypothetical protein